MVKVGRKKKDRTQAFQLIREGKDPKYIMRVGHFGRRTYNNILKEYQALNEIPQAQIDYEKLDQSLRDLDNECAEVVGLRYSEWLQIKRKAWRRPFNYASKVWEAWRKPSLIRLKDTESPLLMRLIATFLNDPQVKAHSRRCKETLKPFLIFLGRSDIADRDLAVSAQRDPREVRYVPEIAFLDFVPKFEQAIAYFKELYGEIGELLIRLKTITKMRTGDAKDDRELFGIKAKETNSSYLLMNNENEFSFHVSAKDNIDWEIMRLTPSIKKQLYAYYQTLEHGEFLFKKDEEMVKNWRKCCIKAGIRPKQKGLSFHDIRKVGLTWEFILGLPLDIACDINVGWKDLNTAKRNYLAFRRAIRKEFRKQYAELIPNWFAEGIEEFIT